MWLPVQYEHFDKYLIRFLKMSLDKIVILQAIPTLFQIWKQRWSLSVGCRVSAVSAASDVCVLIAAVSESDVIEAVREVKVLDVGVNSFTLSWKRTARVSGYKITWSPFLGEGHTRTHAHTHTHTDTSKIRVKSQQDVRNKNITCMLFLLPTCRWRWETSACLFLQHHLQIGRASCRERV